MTKSKKKILYISPNGFLGGAERVVLTMAKAHLINNLFEPVILFFSDGEAVSQAKEYGIKCLILKQKFKLSRLQQLIRALKEIRSILVIERPALIHNTMAYSHLTISLAAVGLSIPKVWFQHGPVGKTLDRLASFFPVELLFFNSCYLKDLHHQSYPHVLIKNKEVIIKLGVDSTQASRDLFKNSEIIFGSAGRITRFKSFEIIIRALGSLKDSVKKPFKLYIAGSPKSEDDHVYYQELLALTKSLDLKKEVVFLGHVEDMTSFYSQLDVFIHASKYPEPFGLVAAEAMENGCLTIGCDQGGITDFLIHEKTGITFPSSSDQSLNALQATLKKILNQETSLEKYKSIAKEGQSFLRKEYSVNQMIRQIEDLYNEII